MLASLFLMSVSQPHDFDFADVDFASGVVLLECEMPFFERQGKVEVLVQFISVDGHFDASHLATAPDVVAHFQFIREPRVWLDELCVNVAHAIQRPGSNGVGMRAVDLCFVTENTILSCHDH